MTNLVTWETLGPIIEKEKLYLYWEDEPVNSWVAQPRNGFAIGSGPTALDAVVNLLNKR